MKNLATVYYKRGYGCAQSILKAAESKYKVAVGAGAYDMAGIMNTGFGIGGMCSVIIASVMVLGLLFDEETAKKKRIVFMSEIQKKLGGINCGMLITRRTGNKKCSDLIYVVSEVLEGVIEG